MDFGSRIAYFLIGVLVTIVAQRYAAVVSDEAALITEHSNDIDRFRDVATDYWIRPFTSQQEEIAAAARVRSQMVSLSLLYPEVQFLCASQGDAYRELVFELYEAATGGSFEGGDRLPDPERIVHIGDSAARLMVFLRQRRRSIVSIDRFFAVRVRSKM